MNHLNSNGAIISVTIGSIIARCASIISGIALVALALGLLGIGGISVAVTVKVLLGAFAIGVIGYIVGIVIGVMFEVKY